MHLPPGRARLNRLLAVAAAFSLALGITQPAAAAGTADWNPRAYRAELGYDAHIPVCLHPNFGGGPPWNTSGNLYHARANQALGIWNAIGADIYLFRTDTSCDYLAALDDNYIQIGFPSQWYIDNVMFGAKGFNEDYVRVPATHPACNQYLFRSCRWKDGIWLNPQNTVDGPWSWSANPPATSTWAFNVIAHELGHSLELDHLNGTNCTMTGNYDEMLEPTQLCGNDIESVLEMFGYGP